MDQFIYWGVFAAFAVIVCLYVVWMFIADRSDSIGPDPRSELVPGVTPLHLLSESQRHDAMERGVRGGKAPEQGTRRLDSDESGDNGSDNGDPPDDTTSRTFWRGK